ncbi:MAG: head maturation protease, ClpP-related [Planctomycetota bacterium]
MRLFNLAGVPKAVSESSAKSLPIQCSEADGDDPAELLIMEEIGEDWWGDGLSAADVVSFVKGLGKKDPINVRINSPGGFVYDGMVMYNALASHQGHVTTIVEGLAFSMASVITMAGDTVKMFKASDFGIHRAWGVSVGNQKDMRAAADWMATIDQHLVEIYEDKSGKSQQQISDWMDGESDGTLFSATESLDHGFADEVVDPKGGKAKDSIRSTLRNSVRNSPRLQAARRNMAMRR